MTDHRPQTRSSDSCIVPMFWGASPFSFITRASSLQRHLSRPILFWMPKIYQCIRHIALWKTNDKCRRATCSCDLSYPGFFIGAAGDYLHTYILQNQPAQFALSTSSRQLLSPRSTPILQLVNDFLSIGNTVDLRASAEESQCGRNVA